MVSICLKVGSKGQIVIPKVFREAYGIKEGGEVIVEPTEKGLVIRGPIEGEELLRKIREERKKIHPKSLHLPGPGQQRPRLRNVHRRDALHAAVIRNNGLQAIVSENDKFDRLPLKRLWLEV